MWKCELIVQIKPWVFNSVQIDMKELLQCEDISCLSVKKKYFKRSCSNLYNRMWNKPTVNNVKKKKTKRQISMSIGKIGKQWIKQLSTCNNLKIHIYIFAPILYLILV